METLTNADIFYLVASVALIVIAVALAIVAYQLVGILKRAHALLRDIHAEVLLFRKRRHGVEVQIRTAQKVLRTLAQRFARRK